jgi:Ulp1 family protease
MVPDDAILCDRILVPINVENEHWTLVEINMKKRTCIYIDSMGHEPGRKITETQRYILRVISRWVELEFRNRVDENARDVIKKICAWRTKPIQQNGYDCGLFVLRIAEHLTRRGWSRVCRVTQDEINTFRGDLFRELEAASLCDDDP